MKFVALQMARTIRGGSVLGAASGVLLFLVALFSKVNFGRILENRNKPVASYWAPRQLL